MKAKWLMLLMVSILVISLGMVACGGETVTKTVTTTAQATSTTEPAKTFTWRYQSVAVEGDYLYGTIKTFAKLVEEATGGIVQVETYPMNSLVAIPDIYNALKTGAIEAGNVIPMFAASECPSLLTTGLPYAPGDAYECWEIYMTWGLADICNEEYNAHGVHFLCPAYGGIVYLGTTVPINTVEDFKGKPFFLVGGQVFLQKLGVVQTDIPGFDYYSALKLGTVVGTSQAINFLETQKLMEVDKYYLKTANNVADGHIVISKKAWDAIGPELQMRIEDHIEANIFDAFKVHMAGEAASEQAAREYGLEFVTLPEEEEAKVREAARLDVTIAEKSPAAAKGVQLLLDWMEFNGID